MSGSNEKPEEMRKVVLSGVMLLVVVGKKVS